MIKLRSSTKTEINQMKYKQQSVLEETNCIHHLHIEEGIKLCSVKEEIKKVNKAISVLQKEKECIGSSILQMKKHIKQIEDKIVFQTISTKDLINTVGSFETNVHKNKHSSGRNRFTKSNTSVQMSKSAIK